MGRIFIIVGKSSTGKDTIYQKVVEQLNDQIKEIVMYTTRPIRDREVEGREYHFVDEEQFQLLKNEGRVIEVRSYHTVYGIWRYFTVDDGNIRIRSDYYIMIGTLESYEQIRDYYGEQYVEAIYIDVETGERLSRALAREKKHNEPKYTELCRRFIADEADFSEDHIKNAGITKKYYNNNLEQCVLEVKETILQSLNE